MTFVQSSRFDPLSALRGRQGQRTFYLALPANKVVAFQVGHQPYGFLNPAASVLPVGRPQPSVKRNGN